MTTMQLPRNTKRQRITPEHHQLSSNGSGRKTTRPAVATAGDGGDDDLQFLRDLLEGLRLINKAAKGCRHIRKLQQAIYLAKSEVLSAMITELPEQTRVSVQHDERGERIGLVQIIDPCGPSRAFHIPIDCIPTSVRVALWNGGQFISPVHQLVTVKRK